MNWIEIVTLLGPIAIGFGAMYLGHRRAGETSQDALRHAIRDELDKMISGNAPTVHDAPIPAAPPAAPDTTGPLIEAIHKILDRMGEKKP